MNEDNSFEALMDPGAANNFFDISNLPEIDPAMITGFSRTNALWLMEFSRLIYRQQEDEKPRAPNFTTRNQFLSAKGWKEVAFFNKDGTQAGLFVYSRLPCAALVFRGTLGLVDTITDATCHLVPWAGKGLIHAGFKAAFEVLWDHSIKRELLKLKMPFFITGHSLGAALAALAAARLCQDETLTHCRPLALYTFGSPRVGDRAFAANFSNLFHCRIVNDQDVVPTVPPPLSLPGFPVFKHVGRMHRLEAAGPVHIFPSDADEVELRGLLAGTADLLEFFKRLVNNARTAGLSPPKPLRDHTPVNYTARLEHLS